MLDKWIESLGRNKETRRAYKRAVEIFMTVNKMTAKFDTDDITHLHYEAFLKFLNKKHKNTSTQSIYSIGVLRFFNHLVYRDLSSVNIQKARTAKVEMLGRTSYKIKQYVSEDVDEVLEAADSIIERSFDSPGAKLRAYRDRAFLLTLAGTGFRVHEACNLKRGDIDWNRSRAVIIGKGDKQATVRFSTKSLTAIKDYLAVRAELDGASGKPLMSLPIFAQHAKSSSDRVEQITTKTGRDIINAWVLRVLGPDKKGTITPHTFRHYFVTEILNATGNIKTAKEMARHSNISVTDRYAQLNDAQLDEEHHKIFG